MTYRVKINVFDGPFDLLLHLIKINEMDIHDLQLAEIANQYLEYIQLMKDLDLEIAGEFLVMSATLINIKARSLLPPREDESVEEEIDEILSAKELMRQLIEYRKFKELSLTLKDKEQQFSRIFFRSDTAPNLLKPERPEEEPLREDLRKLFSAFSRILKYAEAKGFHEVSEEQFTVEDKIAHLRSLLNQESIVDVTEIFNRCINKSEMIAVFLATLELCRLRKITLKQSSLFEPIYLTLGREEPKNNENP